jgi:N-acetylmuramoyl-L-alanine amidase
VNITISEGSAFIIMEFIQRDRCKKFAAVCALHLAALLVASASFAAEIEGVRLWRAPDNTRLVFDLSAPAEHRLFTLSNPERIVIDISASEFSAALNALPLSNTPIKGIRTAPRNGSDVRVVLDMAAKVSPRSFSLRKQGDKLDRLVVDLYDQEQQTVKTQATVAPKETERRDILVVVDAGHGGEDPGALGPRKLKEKDVVLAISKELAALINREPGFKAKLVRTGDYYVALEKRRDFARKERADLFVSIHADAFPKSQANGASVYALSHRGATSETARFLAQRENEADLIGGVGSVTLNDKSPDVQTVLVDLFMKATLGSSLEVGDHVLKNMGSIARLHKKSVEQAAFVVLKSPDVPSILVETGFISNPGEAKKLATSSYRKKMAKQIFTGIKSYFYQAPPVGTYVAWRKAGGGDIDYVIASGDTLSGIAKKHNTSVAVLRRHNQLKSDTIRIGQRIKIPAS